jgi:hypothetical protein
MTRQMTTKADDSQWMLSPQQEAAADLLAVGKTVTQVAGDTDVSRQTVSEWLNHHPGFRAAFNRRRQEIWNQASDRLRALLPKALDLLEKQIEEGEFRAAIEVLKAAGLHGLQRPSGPTTVEDAESEAKEEDNSRRSRALFASLGHP